MSKTYGYCRISTKQQNIERQVRNIQLAYEDAIIVKEAYTGTKVEGRKEFTKLLKAVKAGDTIVFDSVSRMSRNAEDGVNLYMELFNRNINLVFLKEGYINTDVYRSKLDINLPTTDSEIANMYLKTTEQVLMLLAKEQIIIAFGQAQKEVDDLRERTSQGIETARRNGKQIGQEQGAKLVTKKSIQAKEQIIKYSKDFKGTLNDIAVMKLVGIARNTYYKYKREIVEKQGNK
ncbi:recombinase family protein [Cellulosilyticum lentocellum]|uniref:Resolvase domain n=1 Tax=Cellulosilyticum lentocellum (strain ATCC 49066 / DSM 5427 / NCIMB 11756 / RHM5) TaxID=642492 RepID=F2JSV4_CELLD|nr:recombinase family protein [Cellulosilyticum lentocellum]ADZ84075.1 Resolvase domain [Cellulosilyticum lentocellum DSM 5427]